MTEKEVCETSTDPTSWCNRNSVYFQYTKLIMDIWSRSVIEVPRGVRKSSIIIPKLLKLFSPPYTSETRLNFSNETFCIYLDTSVSTSHLRTSPYFLLCFVFKIRCAFPNAKNGKDHICGLNEMICWCYVYILLCCSIFFHCFFFLQFLAKDFVHQPGIIIWSNSYLTK